MSIRGIRNVSGVGCHLSCALLVLCYNLVPLREALIYLADCHQRQPSNPILELGSLLKEMTLSEGQGTGEAVDPSKFFSSFQKQCNAYDLGDAARALSVLLKTIRNLFQQERSEVDALCNCRRQLQALYELLLSGTKEQLIHGQRCEDGKRIVRVKRKKVPLSVPFPIDGSRHSVEDSMQSALQPTRIKAYNWEATTGDYEETIEACEEEIITELDWITTKQFNFTSLPECLLFHLQRFEYQNGRVEAIQDSIDVPDTMNLSCTTGDCSFQLVGGILHSDDAEKGEEYEGGHYTTLLRIENNEWTLVDGEHVTEIVQETALGLLSGQSGPFAGDRTRGTLLVYTKTQSTARNELDALLDLFRQGLSQATSKGHFMFPFDRCDPSSVIGNRIKIRWSGGKFYAGKVVCYSELSGKHTVEYDDGDVKEYKLHKKVVEWDDQALQADWSKKYYT